MAISTNVTFTAWKGHASASLNSGSTTIANNGGHRVLIVGISRYKLSTGVNVSSVTWNGTALTKLGGGGTAGIDQVDIWYLLDPAAVTSTVNITFASTPGGAVAGAIVYDGVDGTTPVKNFAISINDNSRTPAIAVTASSVNNLILNVIAWDRFTATLSAPVAPATSIWLTDDSADEGGAGASQASAASGTVTIDWTNKLSVSANWIAAGCEVVAAAGAGGTTFPQSVSGSLSFSGGLTKKTSKSLAGTLSFSGALTKQVSKAFTGALSFVGSLNATKVILQAVGGTLSFAGTLTRQTGKVLSGAITPTGSLTKRINKAFTGALSFAGSLAEQFVVLQAVSGALSFLGTLGTSFIAGAGGTLRRFYHAVYSHVVKQRVP